MRVKRLLAMVIPVVEAKGSDAGYYTLASQALLIAAAAC